MVALRGEGGRASTLFVVLPLDCYSITEFRLGVDDIPQVRRNQLGLQSRP